MQQTKFPEAAGRTAAFFRELLLPANLTHYDNLELKI